jgi:hypothetical protein
MALIQLKWGADMRAKRLASALLAGALAAAAGGAYAAETPRRQAYSVPGGTITSVPLQANQQAAPSDDRASRYSEVEQGSVATQAQTQQAQAVRPQLVTPSSGGYSIYIAHVDLLRDDDADGFHHRFAVKFDADTGLFSADVYARLYLSYQGGAYYHYYTTDVFTIDGSASDDDYEVTTTLTSGYPTGYYDVAIDLYEAGSNRLVATRDAVDDTGLATLPLEDLAHESGGTPGVSLFTGILLLQDLDYDGFFHRFALDIDVDMPGQSRTVYARIDVRSPHGAWLHEHTSVSFLVDGAGPHDILRVNSVWESGYPPGRYDFRVGVYDAGTHALIAENGPTSPTLTGVPLEDAISDHHANPAPAPLPAPGHGHTVSQGYGGSAASGAWALLAMSMGLLVRIRRGC